MARERVCVCLDFVATECDTRWRRERQERTADYSSYLPIAGRQRATEGTLLVV